MSCARGAGRRSSRTAGRCRWRCGAGSSGRTQPDLAQQHGDLEHVADRLGRRDDVVRDGAGAEAGDGVGRRVEHGELAGRRARCTWRTGVRSGAGPAQLGGQHGDAVRLVEAEVVGRTPRPRPAARRRPRSWTAAFWRMSSPHRWVPNVTTAAAHGLDDRRRRAPPAPWDRSEACDHVEIGGELVDALVRRSAPRRRAAPRIAGRTGSSTSVGRARRGGRTCPRSARRYGSSARNGDVVAGRARPGASSAAVGVTSRDDIDSSIDRRADVGAGGGRTRSSAWRLTAVRSTSAVTNGLPSRSPPIHEPMRTTPVDASTSIAPAVGDELLDRRAPAPGTTSNRLAS